MRYLKSFNENFNFEGSYIHVNKKYNDNGNNAIFNAFKKDKPKKIQMSNLDIKYLERIHKKLGIEFSNILNKGDCICYYYHYNLRDGTIVPYGKVKIEKYEYNWYFISVVNNTSFLEEEYLCNEIEGVIDLYKYLISKNYLKYTIQEFA